MADLERSEAAAGDHPAEGWRRPWMPWAVGLGLVLLGAAVGWVSSFLALRPLMGAPVPVQGKPRPPVLAEAAVAEELLPLGPAAPGEQVSVTWQVINSGGVVWPVDLYRFVPDDEQMPVIPLPHTVSPGERVTIRTLLTLPAATGTWKPAWALTGPKGEVPGGRLSVIVAVQAGERGGSSLGFAVAGEEIPAESGK